MFPLVWRAGAYSMSHEHQPRCLGGCRRHPQQGYRSVSLWVLTGNERAIQFYSGVGFNEDEGSAKEVMLAGKALQEIRYVAELGD